MKMAQWLRGNWFQLVILVVPFVVLALFWDKFPDRVVTHWGGDGKPNRWMNKIPGLLGTPMISIGVAILLGWIPQIDPRLRANEVRSERSQAAVGVVRLAATGLMAFGSILIAANALGYHFDPLRCGINALLLFFAVIGNFMGNIRPNYFVGVRTPWTLESDSVWRDTHRMMGRVWGIGAVGLLIFQFSIRQSLVMPCVVAFFLGTGLLAIPYSWWRFHANETDRLPPS